jgi:hypothetical protein
MHAGGQWKQGRLIERLWDEGNPLSRDKLTVIKAPVSV